MKKKMHLILLAVLSITAMVACGPKCKQCEAQVMGQKSGISREICGEELKQAEESGMFICK